MNGTIHILDTQVLSDWQRQPDKIENYIQSFLPEQLAITVVTVYENLRGWIPKFKDAKTSREIINISNKLIQLLKLYKQINVLPFGSAAAEIYDKFPSKVKQKMGTMDARIAAITLSVKGILITKNTRDFEQIPDLTIEKPLILSSV